MAADVGQLRKMISQRRAGGLKPADNPVTGLQVGNNSGALESIKGKLSNFPGAQAAVGKLEMGATAVRSNPQAALQATRKKAAATFPNARLNPVTKAALKRRINRARSGRDNTTGGAGFRGE